MNLAELAALETRLINDLLKIQAKSSLLSFVKYTKQDYEINWHHRSLCDKLDEFIEGKTKNKLMVFAPPQHGKSEIVSRRLPAYILGRNPKSKIAACSYSASLAGSFNRDVQRIIDTKEYRSIFPKSLLNASNVKTTAKGGYLRNSEIFEMVGFGGFYKSVGVGGPLTGTSVDVGIIDDPIKDRVEANSQTYRDRVWSWYEDVFLTRLHNKSKQLLTLTRWHEDDLAGRLLKREREEWDIIIFEAIKDAGTHPDDPREYGEALWESRHSRKRMESRRKNSPDTFESLYQQRPTKKGGNIVKRDWYGRFRVSDLPNSIVKKAVFDLAYTDKEQNDPTGCLAYAKYEDNYYIFDYTDIRMKFPDLIKYLPDFFARNDISIGYIENKGPGKSAVQSLKRDTSVNVKEYKVPGVDKMARLNGVIGVIEGGRVFLLEGAGWIDSYLNSMCAFPKGKHDEAVDCTTMMLSVDKKNYSNLFRKSR